MFDPTIAPLARLHQGQLHYGAVAALQGVSLTLHRGQLLALASRRLRRIG